MPGPLAGILGAAGPEMAKGLGAAGAIKDATGTTAKPGDVAKSGNGLEGTKKAASEQAVAMVTSSLNDSVKRAYEGLDAQVQASSNGLNNPKSSAPEKDNGHFNATMGSAGAKPA